MMLTVPPHVRKPSLNPTPSSHTRTNEWLKQRKEVQVDIRKHGDAVGWEEGEIPFDGSNAGILEVDPAEPKRREEVVACVGFAVKSLLWKGVRVEPAHQTREGRTEECSVGWSQGRHQEVIE
jgi:hypothetical protein